MTIVKPTIGQNGWGPILNAALDALDAQSGGSSAGVPFDLPGALVVSDSPSIPVLRAFQVNTIAVTLASPGDGPTTVQLLRNGSNAGEVTVESGDLTATATLDPAVSFIAGDRYGVGIAEVGAGAADLGGVFGMAEE